MGNKADKAAARAQKLADILTQFDQHRIFRLERAMARVTDKNQARLVKVHDRLLLQQAEHLRAFGLSRAKLDGVRSSNSNRGGPLASEDDPPSDATDQIRPGKADKARDGAGPNSVDGQGLGRGRSQSDSTEVEDPEPEEEDVD